MADSAVSTMAAGSAAAAIQFYGKEKRSEPPATEPELPEPAKLYCLVVIALFLHTPAESRLCDTGGKWPCPQVIRACQLVEVF